MTGMRTRQPSAKRRPLKVMGPSPFCMPICWAAKAEPQMIDTIKSNSSYFSTPLLRSFNSVVAATGISLAGLSQVSSGLSGELQVVLRGIE